MLLMFTGGDIIGKEERKKEGKEEMKLIFKND